MSQMKIKKDDRVVMLSGKDRGKQGKVLKAFPRERRLIVEGLNIVKKHKKPRRSGEKGQVVEVASLVPAARVALICPSCGKQTRIGIVRSAKKEGLKAVRQRVCKKCSKTIA